MLDIVNGQKDHYSIVIKKDILERLSFINIITNNFEKALAFQQEICEINDKLYLFEGVLPHPLVGVQLY